MHDDPHHLPHLFLVRHGDTDWTDAQKHTGRTDIPLNSAGEARAVQLAARLKHETFQNVFCSPLVRARRTCELTGLLDRTMFDPDLMEWDYGDYEGRVTRDIRADRPGWDLFRDGCPHGESPQQVADRADRFLQKARAGDGTSIAFSSGHMIRMIAARWLGLSPIDGQHFASSTASISILGYEHDRQHPVILLWNETIPSSK